MLYGEREERLAHAYLTAKETILSYGYGPEIDWQEKQGLENVNESEFLREAAWVIISAGFRESIVRAKFSRLSAAFFDWAGASPIVKRRAHCRAQALRVFASSRKIGAILRVAEVVNRIGFVKLKCALIEDPIGLIRTLPFMGPATSLHLAKNLGVPVVKPDRHLLRVAHITGYTSPQEMCEIISMVVGDKPSVVDLVIWRYSTIDRHYLELFRG